MTGPDAVKSPPSASSPIRVLWVIDHVCYDGSLHGGGRLYWDLLPHLQAAGVEVVPCMLRATQEIRDVFRDSPVPVRILDKGKFDLTTLPALLRLIREHRIDVMHLHCYGSSTFGRVAGLLTGVPTIIHDYDTEVYFPYPWYLGFADAALAPATRHAIAASPMVREFLVHKRRMDRDRITMMFHAIPEEAFDPPAPERVEAIRRSLGVASPTRLVGTVTKLGPQRGNAVLVEAAAQVSRAVPDALFLLLYKPTRFHRLPSRRYVPIAVAEEEKAIAELLARARALGIEQRFHVREWPEHLAEWVAACDIVVAPFLSERFSSVHLLEAMAMGKPVIASALGEAQQVIKDGRTGYLVPPGDASALATRITHLLMRPAELERMGREARAASRQYGAPACAERLHELYRRVLANGQSPTAAEGTRA